MSVKLTLNKKTQSEISGQLIAVSVILSDVLSSMRMLESDSSKASHNLKCCTIDIKHLKNRVSYLLRDVGYLLEENNDD